MVVEVSSSVQYDAICTTLARKVVSALWT
ncbi:hypothetical protein BIW11_09775 [Tropilaelaps mercedesae]|uniref:Uncharacterized protein n=1 Tax=Tropilaelaps mercedesae TaxID=418985 RepID=A0A1V9XIV7_9ACAR|nr:hypothetical protein BIW11_09775 [Tropilaelaps mercedesae]